MFTGLSSPMLRIETRPLFEEMLANGAAEGFRMTCRFFSTAGSSALATERAKQESGRRDALRSWAKTREIVWFISSLVGSGWREEHRASHRFQGESPNELRGQAQYLFCLGPVTK